MTPKLVYVASPYTHPDLNVVESRVEAVAQYMATCIGGTGSYVYYSPICHGETIYLYSDLESDYTCWKDHSRAMMRLASEVHVLCLEGWEQSRGVNDEIDFAESLGIPVYYT